MLNVEEFENTVIERVAMAVYVNPSSKSDAHTDRTYQGLVINEPRGRRIYYFSDGRQMMTEGSEVFFLPRGSTYRVTPIGPIYPDSGCYAINFSADISHEPFTMKPRNPEQLTKLFASAAKLWKISDKSAHLTAMGNLYNIILTLCKDAKKAYSPKSKEKIIMPAMEKIITDFNDPSLTVEKLAELCGVSEVYLRKLFRDIHGVSPKEYLVQRRISYAEKLLAAGDFSVGKVAEMCGYGEPCHFSREFFRLVGTSPSKYRK
jgi:AraC-like DNA-binding protein